MTNCCLIITPIPKHLADAVVQFFDVVNIEPEAISVSEVDENTSTWQLAAYFAASQMAEKTARLVSVLGIAPHLTDIRPVPDADWVSLSLRRLGPIRAGRFFVHGRHHRKDRPSHGVNLEIDAGLAFGTGHHGTTRGCLLAFDRLLKAVPPARILDLGCGTGILALAGAKGGKRRVVACDIDPEAVAVTKLNSSVNSLRPWVRAHVAGTPRSALLSGAGPFDLIFANILARPLVALAGPMAGVLAAGGTLILSGITLEQERWIETAYRNFHFLVDSRIRLEGWSTLVLKRPHKAKAPRGKTAGRRRFDAAVSC